MTDPAHSSPRTPRTAAGRALLDEWWGPNDARDPESIERQDAARGIAAIEAEARRLVLAELRAEVANLWTHTRRNGWATPGQWIDRAAVLALVDRHLRDA